MQSASSRTELQIRRKQFCSFMIADDPTTNGLHSTANLIHATDFQGLTDGRQHLLGKRTRVDVEVRGRTRSTAQSREEIPSGSDHLSTCRAIRAVSRDSQEPQLSAVPLAVFHFG